MTSLEPSSLSQPFPNLGDVITTDDVSTKTAGKYKADYINWARTMHLLHLHAPGFQFHLAHYVDSGHVWKAPNGTAYVVGYFTGPNGQRTPDFPQAVMDNRNDAIGFDKVTARDLTDSHRRCLCTAAAAQFGLGWQLWAREEVENPHREEKKGKPAKAPTVKEVSAEDQPLTEEERELLRVLIEDMTAGKREDLCKSFRFAFKLGDNAKVFPAITSRKHQAWIQQNA